MENDKSKRRSLQEKLDLATQSVASYVERSDTLMILAPTSIHENHVNLKTGRKTCYRTWRRRGLCLLEFFACFLSRRKTHPALLVRSAFQTPMWISTHECLKLCVGEADFTCCETNHQGPDGSSSIECCRPTVHRILSRLIEMKKDNLRTNSAVVHARWITVFEHFWIRGLISSDKERTPKCVNVVEFKNIMKWNERIDGKWIDREEVSLLT